MQEYVTDTHSLLWHLFQNKRLSKKAKETFAEVYAGEGRMFIPTIVLVEIVYLLERAKIPEKSINAVIDLLGTSPSNYSLCQITLRTIRTMQSLPRDSIPDMPDRIIAATAVELQLPIISKDKRIARARVTEVIW